MENDVRTPPSLQNLGLNAIERSLPWLEEQLSTRGLAVYPDSGLGVSLAELRKLVKDARERPLLRMPSAEFQRHYLAATGADFLSKALHWGHACGLRSFDEHWRYLRTSNPVLTGPGSGKVVRERAMAWELILASLVATFCRRVDNAEPDLVCEWEGMRVGVAAKVLFKNSRGAFAEHVKKGIQQVQAAEVDAGCVVINLVDVFPHAQMLRYFIALDTSMRARQGWHA